MNIMFLGPAGCGKTSLVEKFGKYLQTENYIVQFVNLDPGCLSLPYSSQFDIRENFTVEEASDLAEHIFHYLKVRCPENYKRQRYQMESDQYLEKF